MCSGTPRWPSLPTGALFSGSPLLRSDNGCYLQAVCARVYLDQCAAVSAVATRMEATTMASLASAPIRAFSTPALAALSPVGAPIRLGVVVTVGCARLLGEIGAALEDDSCFGRGAARNQNDGLGGALPACLCASCSQQGDVASEGSAGGA